MDRTSRFFAEFEELGVARVRKELSGRRWNREKLAAARQWIDRKDVGQWADKHTGPGKARGSKKERSKWVAILIAVAAALFLGIRFLRQMG